MEDETGFVTNYSYGAAGRLKELQDGSNAMIDTYTYDAAGRLARKVKGNGTYTVYAAGRLASIYNYAPDGSVNSKFVYTYDGVGKQIGEQTIDGT